jgi:predicted phosphodiesterase
MRVVDLGILDLPLMIFGGPYSNLQALLALKAVAAEQNIARSQMICTGDSVAYCADPADTVAHLRGFGCPVVAGNVEKQLAENALDCGCGFEQNSTCDRLSAGWFAHADTAIDAEARAWMATLPDVAIFSQAGKRFAVIHGGVTDVSRFIWSNSPEDVFLEEIAALNALVGPIDGILAGHSGIGFQRQIADTIWINAGVIGMPANNGEPYTQYALLTAGQADINSLNYDHEQAAAEMKHAGLTQGYHTALIDGHWPSEDVLPPTLRRDFEPT